jgi:lipoprotein-anchoring transpeptidase ErfK/SrfK
MRFVFLVLAVLGLAACEQPFDGPMATRAATPSVSLPDQSYAPRPDGAHRIATVPTERVDPQYLRQVVAIRTEEAPGTIIIDTAARHLFFILDDRHAIRYGIGVGREGFDWQGVAEVRGVGRWPTWTPPPEMIARQPELARWADGQPGGPSNPLGARAIYLTENGIDRGYRIHGTPEWHSIGQAASSGCIRMFNQDVIDLSARVSRGAKVIVR